MTFSGAKRSLKASSKRFLRDARSSVPENMRRRWQTGRRKMTLFFSSIHLCQSVTSLFPSSLFNRRLAIPVTNCHYCESDQFCQSPIAVYRLNNQHGIVLITGLSHFKSLS